MSRKIEIKRENEKIRVRVPYSKLFIDEARKLNGNWSYKEKVWFFYAELEDKIKEICMDIYGMDGQRKVEKVNVKIYLDELSEIEQEISIIGLEIAKRIYRDYFPKLSEAIILNGGFYNSGGSKNNPMLKPFDGTIIKAKNIPLSLVEKVKKENPKAYDIA